MDYSSPYIPGGFPDILSIQEAFPNITDDKLGHDLAYSAMLTKLPSGLLGLVLASLVAAYMSTISTHLNWGSSYIVNDFYKQQINKGASEKRLVAVGRLSTVILMVFSATLALFLQDAMQIFKFILMFGAGTGLIFILRWFWWRINAWSEISAMFSSAIVSYVFSFTAIGSWLFTHNNEMGIEVEGLLPTYAKFPMVVLITSIIWITVTFMTKPESKNTLFHFYKKIQPGGPGWNKTLNDARNENENIVTDTQPWSVPSGILAMILAMILIYSIMFATGYWIYGDFYYALALTALAIISGFFLVRMWKKLGQRFYKFEDGTTY